MAMSRAAKAMRDSYLATRKKTENSNKAKKADKEQMGNKATKTGKLSVASPPMPDRKPSAAKAIKAVAKAARAAKSPVGPWKTSVSTPLQNRDYSKERQRVGDFYLAATSGMNSKRKKA